MPAEASRVVAQAPTLDLDAARAEADRRRIEDVCALAGVPERAALFAAEGKTAGQVAGVLLAELQLSGGHAPAHHNSIAAPVIEAWRGDGEAFGINASVRQ